MTRIGTPAPGIVPTSLTQSAATAALLAQLPSTLSDVALGAFLTGTVLDRGPNGLTMLQTANGVFGLKTTVPLPVGSTVTLQIQTAGAQLQAIVLSITPPAPGQTAPQTAAAPAGQPGVQTPNTPTAAAPNAATPQPPPAPSTITATVIGPAGGPVPSSVSATPSGAPAPAATSAPQAATMPAAAPAPTGSPTTPAVPSSGPAAASPAVSTSPAVPTASSAAPEQTAQPVQQQPPPLTIPAAAQAAYQRQLNAVPAAPLPTIPQPAPAPTPTAQPAALAQEQTASAKPLMPDVAPSPLPTGTQVQVRLLPALQSGASPLLPQQAEAPAETMAAIVRQQSAAHSSHPNAVIMATVVARTPAGQVILDSAVGRLLAPLPRDGQATAPGARLFLELVGGGLAAAQRAAPANAGIAALARNWSSLKDAMRQLQDAPAQQDAYAALERALPKPGPRLAQQMLSYLENAQNGVKAWLGDTVARALGNGRMLEQLERDMREMHHARHGADGDWRMTLVPLLDGSQLRQLRFFERRRKREEAKRKKDEPGRFVVECEHSQHGTLQLDGLMHERRLDLIVRSHEPLPNDMERDILVLFGETCTGLNLTGQLFFQSLPIFPVHPLDDIAKEPVRVSV